MPFSQLIYSVALECSIIKLRDFPGGLVVKNPLPVRGLQIPALVRELRPHMQLSPHTAMTNLHAAAKTQSSLNK